MAKKNKATVLDAMTAASSSIINQCLQTTLWAAAALRNGLEGDRCEES